MLLWPPGTLLSSHVAPPARKRSVYKVPRRTDASTAQRVLTLAASGIDETARYVKLFPSSPTKNVRFAVIQHSINASLFDVVKSAPPTLNTYSFQQDGPLILLNVIDADDDANSSSAITLKILENFCFQGLAEATC